MRTARLIPRPAPHLESRRCVGGIVAWLSTACVDGDEHVVRGGAFDDPAEDLRTARRDHQDPRLRSHRTGFRLIRSLPDPRPLAPPQVFTHACPDRSSR